jgi:hypothetical protein
VIRLGCIVTAGLAALVFTGCQGDAAEPQPPPAPDLTPPAVTVHPIGGLYGEVQFVTIATGEVATVLYTLDGSEPQDGAAATVTGSSPLFWIRIGQGTTTLRYRARDKAGNLSPVRSETYVVDVALPVISISDMPTLTLLGQGVARWQVSKEADYVVELVLDGQVPMPIDAGRAAANIEVATSLSGLAIAQGTPPLLRIRVNDLLGHPATLDQPTTPVVGPVPVALFMTSGSCLDLALLPSGALALATVGAKVMVLDADPSSPNRDQVLGELVLAGQVVGLAPSTDSARVFATSLGPGDSFDLTAFDPSTRQVLGHAAFTGWPLHGAAVTPDGSRVFFRSSGPYGYEARFADADPSSATFLAVAATWPTSSQGSRPVVGRSGLAAVGDQVLDLGRSGPTIAGTSVSQLAAAASVAISPAGDRLFISDLGSRLLSLDPAAAFAQTGLVNLYPDPAWAMAVWPDGAHLLVARGGQVQVWRTTDLTLEASVDVVAKLDGRIWRMELSPSADEAWLLVSRFGTSPGCQVVRLPLR